MLHEIMTLVEISGGLSDVPNSAEPSLPLREWS